MILILSITFQKNIYLSSFNYNPLRARGLGEAYQK